MSHDPPPNTWLTSDAVEAFLRGRRDNDIKVNLRGILVPIQSVHYRPVADVYVIELVDGEDLRIALEPDRAPPHVWNFESQTWLCLSCKQVSTDPCQCGCHEEGAPT